MIKDNDYLKQKKLKEFQILASWLDDKLPLPGTDHKIGLDAIIGLIPIVGDVSTGLFGLYLIYWSKKLKIPMYILLKMMFNLTIDVSLGCIPLIGDIYDIYYKSNKKNLELILNYFEKISK